MAEKQPTNKAESRNKVSAAKLRGTSVQKNPESREKQKTVVAHTTQNSVIVGSQGEISSINNYFQAGSSTQNRQKMINQDSDDEFGTDPRSPNSIPNLTVDNTEGEIPLKKRKGSARDSNRSHLNASQLSKQERKCESNLSALSDVWGQNIIKKSGSQEDGVPKMKKHGMQADMEVIHNVQKEFKDMFRPSNLPNPSREEEDSGDRRLRNLNKRDSPVLPEYEQDSGHEEWKTWPDFKISENHKLRQVMSNQKTWQNVPPPVKAVFNDLIEFLIEKDITLHHQKARAKRRNTMNQRASILLNRYCHYIQDEVEIVSQTLDMKINKTENDIKSNMVEQFQQQLQLISENKMRHNSQIDTLEQKVIGVNKNYNKTAKGIENFMKDMEKKMTYLSQELHDDLDKKFAQCGLDLEVVLMDNEGGNWKDKGINMVNPVYQLDKIFPERIKKPLEFDEIDVDNDDWESEPQEVARVKLSYWSKQRLNFLEKDNKDRQQIVSELIDSEIYKQRMHFIERNEKLEEIIKKQKYELAAKVEKNKEAADERMQEIITNYDGMVNHLQMEITEIIRVQNEKSESSRIDLSELGDKDMNNAGETNRSFSQTHKSSNNSNSKSVEPARKRASPTVTGHSNLSVRSVTKKKEPTPTIQETIQQEEQEDLDLNIASNNTLDQNGALSKISQHISGRVASSGNGAEGTSAVISPLSMAAPSMWPSFEQTSTTKEKEEKEKKEEKKKPEKAAKIAEKKESSATQSKQTIEKKEDPKKLKFKKKKDKKLKKIPSDELIARLEELKGENDMVDILADNMLQLRQRTVPKIIKTLEELISDRIKISETKMKKVITDRIAPVAKQLSGEEKQIRNVKVAVTSASEFVNKLNKRINALDEAVLKLSPEHALSVINQPIRDPATGQIQEPVELDLEQALDSEEPMPGDEEKAESVDDDFMEKYIEQQMKEHVYPMKESMMEKTAKITELTEKAGALQKELKTLDEHYTGVCKAILKTNGIMIADLTSHNIFQEYQGLVKKNEKKLLERKNKRQNEFVAQKKGQQDFNEANIRGSISPDRQTIKTPETQKGKLAAFREEKLKTMAVNRQQQRRRQEETNVTDSQRVLNARVKNIHSQGGSVSLPRQAAQVRCIETAQHRRRDMDGGYSIALQDSLMTDSQASPGPADNMTMFEPGTLLTNHTQPGDDVMITPRSQAFAKQRAQIRTQQQSKRINGQKNSCATMDQEYTNTSRDTGSIQHNEQVVLKASLASMPKGFVPSNVYKSKQIDTSRDFSAKEKNTVAGSSHFRTVDHSLDAPALNLSVETIRQKVTLNDDIQMFHGDAPHHGQSFDSQFDASAFQSKQLMDGDCDYVQQDVVNRQTPRGRTIVPPLNMKPIQSSIQERRQFEFSGNYPIIHTANQGQNTVQRVVEGFLPPILPTTDRDSLDAIPGHMQSAQEPLKSKFNIAATSGHSSSVNVAHHQF